MNAEDYISSMKRPGEESGALSEGGMQDSSGIVRKDIYRQ
jgi:hypothetical protein